MWASDPLLGVCMRRERVRELHYITDARNLGSILAMGLLCHQRAGAVPHQSVASEEIQERRRLKRLPNGERLHSYVNLYFDARNPMMYKLLQKGLTNLIVICVSPDVLGIPGTILTDGNAAAEVTGFYPSPDGLGNLDENLIYAQSWNDPDYWTKVEKKRVRCAEVLVPELISPAYIRSCYADNSSVRASCRQVAGSLRIEINRSMYFNG
jgi:hypothetical protein